MIATSSTLGAPSAKFSNASSSDTWTSTAEISSKPVNPEQIQFLKPNLSP
jgi:hypothetical protein